MDVKNHWEGSSQSLQADPRGRQFAAAALGGPSSGQVALLVARQDLLSWSAIDLRRSASICWTMLALEGSQLSKATAKGLTKSSSSSSSLHQPRARCIDRHPPRSQWKRLGPSWTYHIWPLRGRMQGKWWWGIDGNHRFSARLVVEIWYDLMLLGRLGPFLPCQIARRAETKIQWDQHASPGLRVCWVLRIPHRARLASRV